MISIREMAEKLSGFANVDVESDVADEKEKKGFNPMQKSSLDNTELQGIGWVGCFDSDVGLSHTIKILKEII